MRTIKKKIGKKHFKVTLAGPYVKALDRLVEKGFYMKHQDAIREALRRLFVHRGIELSMRAPDGGVH